MIARLVDAVGLADEINASVELLKVHRPYHESDRATRGRTFTSELPGLEVRLMSSV